MSNTPSRPFTRETATIRRGGSEQSHLGRMATLYAWILVTLVIFALATMLAGLEDSRTAGQVPGSGQRTSTSSTP